MPASRPYAAILDAIGFYLEERQAGDIFVDQIEGGYLVCFLAAGAQRVETISEAEMAALQATANRQRRFRGWKVKPAEQLPLRTRLRALGLYLDQRNAASIVVQERADGLTVEYTGVPADDLDALIRLCETIDDGRLRSLLP